MNPFTLTIWTAAVVPIAGHLYCLWNLRSVTRSANTRSAYLGVLLGFLIVALNICQLLIGNLHGHFIKLIPIAAPAAALLFALFAIRFMRRSGDFEVQSVGIPAVILSLFSMATVVALGSLTIAG